MPAVLRVGAGTLTLTRANTFTGATMISAGTLLLDTNGGIASTEIGFGVRDSSVGLLTVNNIRSHSPIRSAST